MEERRIIVIAGPTGSGESTITNAIVERFSKVKRLVTATSRAPRSGEIQNVHYYFFSKEDFLAKVDTGDILEVNYQADRDVYYGTYAPDLHQKLDAGYLIVVNPDIVGARYYKKEYNATTIFIEPRSVEELRARIEKRNPEMSTEELNRRMEYAERELKEEKPFYDYVIQNGDGELDSAIEQVVAVLQKEGYTLE